MARKQVKSHGNRDAFAAGLLFRDWNLTNSQIAKIIGCEPESLASREKYPTLARVRALLQAMAEEERGNRRPRGSRPDCRRNGRSSADFEGDES